MIVTGRSFWSGTPAHAPVTDTLVREAEAALGVSLPPEFVALLRIQNGGYTQGFAYPTMRRTSWAEDHVPLPWIGGIATSTGADMNILDSDYMTKEWHLPPKQVLIFGEGAFWLTLDYRVSPIPSIAWIDVECGEDMQLSSSFADFIAGLVPATHYE